jgi:pilus assembly protein Flp/PilA
MLLESHRSYSENQMYKFLLNETGLELSEYAVAAALVAIAVVAAFTALGDAIGIRLDLLANRVG